MFMKIYKLPQNRNLCFKGIEFNGKGFILTREEGESLLKKDLKNRDVVKKFLIGRDVNKNPDQTPSRCVIDFQDWPLKKPKEYPECFEIIEKRVKPERLTKNQKSLRVNWWQPANPFKKQRFSLKGIEKFIVTSRVSKHRFFSLVENKNILPESAVCFFPIESYTFLGILSSKFHIEWVKINQSSFENDGRYTNTTCFETFPFLKNENSLIAEIMRELDFYRKSECLKQNLGLTKIYNQMFENKLPVLKDYHKQLDEAVADFYGFPKEKLQSKREILKFLISLNHEFYETLH